MEIFGVGVVVGFVSDGLNGWCDFGIWVEIVLLGIVYFESIPPVHFIVY